jgi:hypothetical protein
MKYGQTDEKHREGTLDDQNLPSTKLVLSPWRWQVFRRWLAPSSGWLLAKTTGKRIGKKPDKFSGHPNPQVMVERRSANQLRAPKFVKPLAGACLCRWAGKCCAHVENTRLATAAGWDKASASFHSRFAYNLNYLESKVEISNVPIPTRTVVGY